MGKKDKHRKKKNESKNKKATHSTTANIATQLHESQHQVLQAATLLESPEPIVIAPVVELPASNIASSTPVALIGGAVAGIAQAGAGEDYIGLKILGAVAAAGLLSYGIYRSYQWMQNKKMDTLEVNQENPRAQVFELLEQKDEAENPQQQSVGWNQSVGLS